MNEELLKSLNGAIDAAIKELASIDSLSKSDISLQDAKLRPEGANGDLPGVGTPGESVLKPEDAKKAEAKAEPEAGVEHAKKGENPFASKDEKKDDDKKDEKKDDKKDEEDEEDWDDEKAEKMKAKMKKYEENKAKKAASCAPDMTKSATVDAEELRKSIVTQVEEVMAKNFNDRLGQLEGMIQKLVGTPAPRQSVSGLAPLAKSSEDVQPAAAAAQAATLTKGAMLDQLFVLQKNDDKRVDSTVITRVEMGDYSVLAERGINLK